MSKLPLPSDSKYRGTWGSPRSSRSLVSARWASSTLLFSAVARSWLFTFNAAVSLLHRRRDSLGSCWSSGAMIFGLILAAFASKSTSFLVPYWHERTYCSQISAYALKFAVNSSKMIMCDVLLITFLRMISSDHFPEISYRVSFVDSRLIFPANPLYDPEKKPYEWYRKRI